VRRSILVLALAVVLAACGGATPTPKIIYVTPEPAAEATVKPETIAPAEATPKPTPKATPTPKPTAKPTPKPTAKPTPKPTAKPTPKPVSYNQLSDRTWKLLVKTPDKFIGRGYQLWACIWQFDAATGDDAFLGNASNRRQTYWNLYGENASFTGNAGRHGLDERDLDWVVLLRHAGWWQHHGPVVRGEEDHPEGIVRLIRGVTHRR